MINQNGALLAKTPNDITPYAYELQGQVFVKKKLERVHAEVLKALEHNSYDIALDLTEKHGGINLRFSFKSKPYIQWESSLPATVAARNGRLDQHIFEGNLPEMLQEFRAGIRQANIIRGDLGLLQKDYKAVISYDAAKDVLEIAHELFEAPACIKPGTLGELKNDVETVVAGLWDAMENKTAQLRADLEAVCDERSLRYQFTMAKKGGVDVVDVQIESPNFRKAENPLVFHDSCTLNPLEIEAAAKYARDVLPGRFRAFREVHGIRKWEVKEDFALQP